MKCRLDNNELIIVNMIDSNNHAEVAYEYYRCYKCKTDYNHQGQEIVHLKNSYMLKKDSIDSDYMK